MKTLVGDAREIKSLGYPSVRENWCRPYGTRAFVPLHPGTSEPGFHGRATRLEFRWCLFHR